MPVQPLVLVCPLDWGLGHASRVIPVINRYILCGYRVMLGVAGKSGELLKRTFPELMFLDIPSYEIRYPGNGRLLFMSLIFQLPQMIVSMHREHLLIKKLVKLKGINIVVSDNRYGLFSSHSHNIIITHQVSPVLPVFLKWAEYPLSLLLRFLIQRFDECWIPDLAGNINLSGNLSHRFKLPRNARYIGILSRFSNMKDIDVDLRTGNEKSDLVIILSGPQPMLRKFTRLIISQARFLPVNTLIIGGLQDEDEVIPQLEGSLISYVAHLESDEFREAVQKGGIVICRSGYSGIMDLAALNRTAVLIPTPGQTEQEYLASYLAERGMFESVIQSEMDLNNMADKIKKASSDQWYQIFNTEDIPVYPLFQEKNN